MEHVFATGYTHSDNGSDNYTSQKRDFRVEANKPAYYQQQSVHCGDRTVDGYHELQSAAVAEQFPDAGYLHSEYDNYIYFPQQQVNYMEESISSSYGEPPLQSTGIILDINDIIPGLYDAFPIGQHSTARYSYLDHDNYTCSSDQQYMNNEMNTPAFSGQHPLQNTGVTPDLSQRLLQKSILPHHIHICSIVTTLVILCKPIVLLKKPFHYFPGCLMCTLPV